MKTETLTTKVPPRVMALNAIQFLGVLAVALTAPTADQAAILAMLPPEFQGYLAKAGWAMIAAKPAINLAADWIDNGKLDRSFQLLFLIAASLSLVACNTLGLRALPPTADGCFPLERTLENGAVYAAGPCVGEDGRIDRYFITWKNREGVTFAARYILADRKYLIKYQADPAGPWITYDPTKGNVSLDFPEGVSLDGNATGEQIIPAG